MNKIDMNYMTSTYYNFIKSQERKSQVKPEFAEHIRKLYEKGNDVWQTSGGRKPLEEAAGEQTLEEYRQYIYDKIYRMQMDSSQIKNSVSVHISDEGFLAMKNDPEYEAWVLETIQKDLSAPGNVMGAGRYTVHYFGATREEYRAQSFSKGDSFCKREEDSYWERRKKRKEQLKKEYELLLEKKRLIRKIQQELFLKKKISWAQAEWEAKRIVY